ncbi:hypothetical protein C1752_12232 [Acaryochloris thomasi RCC1774]|uniref:Glycosyltransferase n=1 Tax=Acaryochloris thomasi RCC1774 TaxID=1764569 RepID=A0A2W1J7L1_9CYAN|nr:glycosyltransferase [Acaryochloris thomasi]PZD70449.1 hypothetical protein C1752_12232 [Acaryochloris thomasi RCC1774]
MNRINLLLVIPIVFSITAKLVGLILAIKYFKQESFNKSDEKPSISIIVPVRGLDQGAEENYKSYLSQKYSGTYDIIFALEDSDDPATLLLKKIQKESLNSCPVHIVYSHNCLGSGKLKNQIAGIQKSNNDVFVLVDSDVRLSPDFLSRHASSIVTNDEIGIAFAVPAAVGSKNWIAALHNISVCASIINSGVSAQQEKISAAVGSCMVTRREVVERIGGLECIAKNKVGLDISFSQAVTKAGYRLKLLREPARIYHHTDTLRRLWWQVHRWLVTIRYYFPSLTPITIFLGIPFWWSLAFLITTILSGNFQILGIFLVICTLVTDITSAAAINIFIVRDKQLWPFLWVAALSEIWVFPIFIQSIFSKRVLWRNRWITLDTDTLSAG